MLTCSKCGEEKRDEDFHRERRCTRRRGRASWCKECVYVAVTARRRANPTGRATGRPPADNDSTYAALPYWMRLRYRAVMLLGGRCVVCGFDDLRALDIDHVDGGGGVERQRGKHRVFRRVLDGAPGYQVLCANHHRIKTFEAGRGVDNA